MIQLIKTILKLFIDEGLIPKGKKRQGFKELSWKKSDLDKFLTSLEK